MKKLRCRTGIRLNWPFTNAGTFVVYVTNEDFTKIAGAMSTLQGYLELAGLKHIADRLFFEAS